MNADDHFFIQQIRSAVGQSMFGLERVVDALLVGLITGGHALLEGNPGLGKTSLVRRLAKATGLREQNVGRIQFTPDLMPSDITGTLMPDPEGQIGLRFEPGPIFKWLLLADEINRATPKTQAALLEAMAERQVTVLGHTYPLCHNFEVALGHEQLECQNPFMVLATQNPIDLEGTYNLPEAQSDRFMFKLLMPSPAAATLASIIAKEAEAADLGAMPSADDTTEHELAEKFAIARLQRISDGLKEMPLPQEVRDHIINLVLITSDPGANLVGVDARHRRAAGELVSNCLKWPLGPRAAIAAALAVKGWAFVQAPAGSNLRQLADGFHAALGEIAAPVLRHRLQTRFGWEEIYLRDHSDLNGASSEKFENYLIRDLVLLTSPSRGAHQVLAQTMSNGSLPWPGF